MSNRGKSQGRQRKVPEITISARDHDFGYWLERAKTRLDSVNWSEGKGFVSMGSIQEEIAKHKMDRYGEIFPTYVKSSEWGKYRGTDGGE